MNKKPVLIVVTGPESCGKTTLVEMLCLRLPNAHSVKEYSRFYLEEQQKTAADSAIEVNEILAHQTRELRTAMALPYDFVISDTDDVCHMIWTEEVFGISLGQWQDVQPDITLLCAPDLPWSFDPMRVNPHDRDRLFDRYVEKLNLLKRPFGVVSGQGAQRGEEALRLLGLHGFSGTPQS